MQACASSTTVSRVTVGVSASAGGRRTGIAAVSPAGSVVAARSAFLGSSAVARVSAASRAEQRGVVFVRAADAAAAPAPKKKKKAAGPSYPLAVGDIVRVIKEKFEGSIESQASHAAVYTGLGYIYEDRGEVLECKTFKSGDYALVAWAGIPTTPAWLRMDQLEKRPKLVYQRM